MDASEPHEQILTISRLVDRWAEEHLTGKPNWGPLRAAIPIEWCDGFMWMQRVIQGGVSIELYKHGITRRYLNLDESGRAYEYTGSHHREISVEEAMAIGNTPNADNGIQRRAVTQKPIVWLPPVP